MKRPNVLFLFSDQHRGDWMPYDEETRKNCGFDDIPLKMQSIKSLMDNGITFTRNASSSPLCVPARACLASGMAYDHCDVYNNDFCFPLNKKTFYSVLKNGGYTVLSVGKSDLHKPIFYWGENGWINQMEELGFNDAIDTEGKYDLLWSSFDMPRGPYALFLKENGLLETHHKDYIRRYLNANDVEPTELPDYAYSDNWVTNNALSLLKKYDKSNSPWFMMVNFSGPHNPWDVTPEMKKTVENLQFPIPSNYSGDKEELNAVRQNYAAMLENIDRNIGIILDYLKATNQFDNTLIIYASDHGEMLGDHNRYMKSVPYKASVHIPLVISGPGVIRKSVCDELVMLHDIASTILDFAGLDKMEGSDSISLKPLATGESNTPIRQFQTYALFNSIKHQGHYEGYRDLEKFMKTKTDSEYIEEFNKRLKLDTSKTSMTKYYYHGDWKCITTKEYKLIIFKDAPPELYDLMNDVGENNNIASSNPDIVERLSSMYQFSNI